MHESLQKQKIALLGATGYIGRSLIGSANELGLSVVPFSRDVTKAKTLLHCYGISIDAASSYDMLLDEQYDVVINATGVGSPKKLSENPMAVFSVTEEMDDLVFKYLAKYPDTRVFNLSSAAVYSAIDGSENVSDYAKAKLASEERHREHSEYEIIDLRVFAFISRWLDTNESFFISEVAKCLRDKAVFHTNNIDMVRDYCIANDIWEVIRFLEQRSPENPVYDMRSAKPVNKFEILDKLKEKFGLNYEILSNLQTSSPTGDKNEYYSKSEDLIKLGFVPQTTALQNIENELEVFLRN